MAASDPIPIRPPVSESPVPLWELERLLSEQDRVAKARNQAILDVLEAIEGWQQADIDLSLVAVDATQAAYHNLRVEIVGDLMDTLKSVFGVEAAS